MITATHAVVYAEDAPRARAFLGDVLGFPFVDAHDGWLIFRLPPAELGVHPTGPPGDPARGAPSGHHELYLMCDDVSATVADLEAKGVEFTGPVEDQGFGLLVRFRVPGAGEIGLYQPRHTTAYQLGDGGGGGG
ncbi:MAG TPA: VOC family protein [Acidimicrobiales bacterium]|nr:VOC family protein [Acidimicrobiales bacterium]